MRRALAAGVLSLAVLAVVAPSASQYASAQSLVDAPLVCSAHHKFGAQPVDVAKTPDGTTVLAHIAWNWHDAIGCYLTLDEGATAVLREASPPTSLPSRKTAASQLCSEHHEFGVNPVDVAKSADGSAVLARLVWNWHDAIGCYLTLDAQAVETLQAAHVAASAPEPTPDPTPEPTPDPTGSPSELPENISGWEYFATENDDGSIQGYERIGVRTSGAGTQPSLYARCYGNNTSFDVYIFSDTSLSRHSRDERVVVSFQLPEGDLRTARWWASDAGDTVVFSHDSFTAEALAAGAGTLTVTITGADGAAQSHRFDMTGFTEVIETLSQKCPVPLAATPNGDGDPGTQPVVSISVPAVEPTGRCAHMIAQGVYQWEQLCAWVGYWENELHNWVVSDHEATELLARIWAEIDVVGKPATPPTSGQVVAGTLCALHDNTRTIGCYLPALHHIRRLDPSLGTLLHEAAHALVADHPTIIACRSLIDDYDACIHNDIFRCVVSHLYTEYAGIPDPGVCGTASKRPATSPPSDSWTSSRNDDGTSFAWVPVHLHTMDPPYEDADAWLGAMCRDEDLDIFLWVESGYLAGQYRHNGRIPGVYHFIPDEWWGWDSQRQSSHTEANFVQVLWHESTNKKAAFLPDDKRVDFVNQAVDRENDWVLIRLQNFNEKPFGTFSFSTEGAYTHIKPVTEDCGWTWS